MIFFRGTYRYLSRVGLNIIPSGDTVLGINFLQEHGHYKEKFKLVVGKVLNESDIFPKEDRNFGLCNL